MTTQIRQYFNYSTTRKVLAHTIPYVYVDTTNGAFSLTLPPKQFWDEPVILIDEKGTFASRNLTLIAGTGYTISSGSVRSTNNELVYLDLDKNTNTLIIRAFSAGGGGGSTTILDVLTSTSTTAGLSANQGKTLKTLNDTNATNIATNTNAITVNTTNINTLTASLTTLTTTANTTFAGALNATTGLLTFVTVEGSTLGFTSGSALPTSTTALGNAFVVITTAGTFTPTGGSSTTFNVGDQLIANGTVYQKIATGTTLALGSTSTAGILQTNDTLTSTATNQALTANQGKTLKTLNDTNATNITTNTTNLTNNTTDITALKTTANTAFVGTISATTGLLSFVTVKGASLGFTNGSALPTSTTALGNAFVVVTTAGTFTPTGGSSTTFNVGDILIANGTVYQKLATGSSSGSAPSGLVTLTDTGTIPAIDTSLVDASGNGNFKIPSLQGNRTLTFSNLTTIRNGKIKVIQDSTGGRTLIAPNGTLTPSGGGILLTGTANAVDFVYYYYDGTTLHISTNKDFR